MGRQGGSIKRPCNAIHDGHSTIAYACPSSRTWSQMVPSYTARIFSLLTMPAANAPARMQPRHACMHATPLRCADACACMCPRRSGRPHGRGANGALLWVLRGHPVCLRGCLHGCLRGCLPACASPRWSRSSRYVVHHSSRSAILHACMHPSTPLHSAASAMHARSGGFGYLEGQAHSKPWAASHQA